MPILAWNLRFYMSFLLQDFQRPVKCFFRLTPGKDVSAKVSEISTDEWEVECDEVDVRFILLFWSLEFFH